jgi:hypothetical protein
MHISCWLGCSKRSRRSDDCWYSDSLSAAADVHPHRVPTTRTTIFMPLGSMRSSLQRLLTKLVQR